MRYIKPFHSFISPNDGFEIYGGHSSVQKHFTIVWSESTIILFSILQSMFRKWAGVTHIFTSVMKIKRRKADDNNYKCISRFIKAFCGEMKFLFRQWLTEFMIKVSPISTSNNAMKFNVKINIFTKIMDCRVNNHIYFQISDLRLSGSSQRNITISKVKTVTNPLINFDIFNQNSRSTATNFSVLHFSVLQ